MKPFLLAICILQFAFHYTIAQDTAIVQDAGETEKYPVMETFRNHQLINAQTVEMLQTGGYEFKIQHRFGEIGYDDRFYKEFLGLALSANIRISLTFPFTTRWYTGIGWSKNKKIIDIESKYLLLRQTEENEIPVSVAAYFNGAIATEVFPKVPSNAFYSDSLTPFNYELYHRLSYNFQLIIARKFSERISFQVSPVFIWKNLVDADKDNHTLALLLSGRYKVTDNNSIIFEYAHIRSHLSDKHGQVHGMDNFRDPASIGYEIATSGHAFQIIMSSNNNIPEQEIYTNNSVDYLGKKGKTSFLLGFNIKRMLFKPRISFKRKE